MRGRWLLAVVSAASVGAVAVALANGAAAPSQPTLVLAPAVQAGCDHAAHIHPSREHATCLRAERRLASSSSDEHRDVMDLTDEAGNWFRSRRSGSPLSVVPAGGRVDFVAGHLTNTKHTATLVNKPPASRLVVDQDDAKNGGIASAEFDAPGVYLFLCKVHPYMTGVVGVTDSAGNIPPVTAQQLPFIGHLDAASLPATTVLAVPPSVAPTEADKAWKWDVGSTPPPFDPAIPGVGEVWIDTQFESVAGQMDDRGVPKPGTISVVDAATWDVEREVDGLDPQARFRWNNPHNMWADTLFVLKLGGGYYLHVASQFSNKLTVVDVDPDGDGVATDAAVVGRVLLANGVPGGPRTTDGTGGQGIKPLPNVYDGWVQDTVTRAAQTDAEVQGWIARMTPCQRNPAGPTCAPAGPGR